MAKKTTKKAEKSKGPVTKDMTLGDVVQKFPESAEVMFKHGLHCIGCHVAAWETIEQGAEVHGVNADTLVKDINVAINKKEK